MAKRTKKRMPQPEAIEADLFSDDFFSQPPAPSILEPAWEEPEERTTLAPNKQRAMHATIAIFALFAVTLGGFVVYTQLIMPTPVALGASASTFTLPQAAFVEPTIAAAPVVAEPVVAEPVVAEPVVAEPVVAEPVVVAPVVAAAAVIAPAETKPRTRVTETKSRAIAAPAAKGEPDSLGAQAMRELNAGHAADARRIAQQATQTNPERADGWIVLGAANDALGDHAAAKAAYVTCTARAFGPRVDTCRALAR